MFKIQMDYNGDKPYGTREKGSARTFWPIGDEQKCTWKTRAHAQRFLDKTKLQEQLPNWTFSIVYEGENNVTCHG